MKFNAVFIQFAFVSAHRDISFTGWHHAWGFASWCLTKPGDWKTERGRLLYCKYAPVWNADVCLVTHPRWLSSLSLPSIQLLFLCAQARHPRTSLLLGFLGYSLAFISMANIFSPLWHLSVHPPKVGWFVRRMSAMLTEMIHVEVDPLPLCYLSFSLGWRVLKLRRTEFI